MTSSLRPRVSGVWRGGRGVFVGGWHVCGEVGASVDGRWRLMSGAVVVVECGDVHYALL